MTWNDAMGLCSTIALALPLLLLITTKLTFYKSFPALALYYAIAVADNIFLMGYINARSDVSEKIGLINNILDAPLILTFLAYFCTTPGLKQKMKIVVGAFIAFEVVIVSIFGFHREAITIIMGPGILMILGFSLPFFVHQTKITVQHHKAVGKALMIASLLLAYGCFMIIYAMYYLLNLGDFHDTLLVFFIVTSFSPLLMAYGIYLERTRVRKLSELKIVRKELSELYPSEKVAAPLKPVIFDFDKEQWN